MRNGEGIVVAGGVRTAIGKFAGAFKDTPSSDLGANAIRAAVERAGIAPEVVDEVILGCVGQVGEDAFNARLATLKAGLPEKTTAFNVNRLCGSGLQAINSAVQELRTGEAQVVVAGGNENMSIQPYLLPRSQVGWRLGEATLIDGTMSLVTDPFGRYQMGSTAEKVADRYGVSREAQDKFAAESQRRAAAAIAEGRFDDQIVPVAIPQKKGDPVIARVDEHPRPGTTVESLSRLKPAFREGGSVTAGNSSGINDAGAAVVVMTREKADELGVTPQLEWVADAVAGIAPEIMGVAPIFAVQNLLKKVGMTINDIDLMELNEAFAAQAVAVIRELEIDPEKVNPNGGAIALGHPVGATGAILTVKLAYELKRRQAEWGIVTMCIGGGQGIATLFRNLN
ncbi:MAG: acetyl-CoA acetyltransferase [Candidatus Rokubacteria bacterium 13_1_40CM_4_67_11]|nr:MAG: acetyl-CoA acetyltransferase [Candidatus Rokubacteria bacterium 13_1_40CM_4_67_11]